MVNIYSENLSKKLCNEGQGAQSRVDRPHLESKT